MAIIKKCTLMMGFISTLLSSAVCAMNTAVDSTQIKTHFNYFSAISCDSRAQHCLAAGVVRNANGSNEQDYVVRATEDGGSTWNNPVILQRFLKTADERDQMLIHCDASGLVCLMTVTMHNSENPWPERAHVAAYMTHDAGKHWSEPTLLPGVLQGIVKLSCNQSGQYCLLLGQYNEMSESHLYVTQNAGFTWSGPIHLPKSNEPYTEDDRAFAMSCADSGLVCTVVGGSIHPITYTTQDGGGTWQGPQVFKEEINEIPGTVGDDFFSNLHCNRSGLRCIALRHQSIYQNAGTMVTAVYAYMTTDGGGHWQKAGNIDNLDGEIYEPFSIFDCDKEAQTCFAIHSPVGVEGAQPRAYATSDGGKTWAKKALEIPEGLTTTILLDIFCDDTAVLCQAVGMKDPH